MKNVVKYVSIKEIISRVLRHPLLKDFNLEQAIQYVSDFTDIFGLPDMFENKEATVEIKDYRGELPCDCVSIIQVKDCKSRVCYRAMQDNFLPNDRDYNKLQPHKLEHIPPHPIHHYHRLPIIYTERPEELAFKVQGNIIFTSNKFGKILISYKAIPLDKDGYPLLIDNGIYLKTLELYIKKELFLVLFETGKVSSAVIQNVQQDYAWRAGQLQKEFTTPSLSEMESIARMWTAMIPRVTSFDNGFRDNANREYIRQH